MDNALISLKPKYVKKILAGEKTIELRRRSTNILPGTRLWIYSTLPSGSIEAIAEVESTHTDTPKIIWEKYSSEIGLSKNEFDTYVLGSNMVTAIAIRSIRKIDPSLTLHNIKEKNNSFHPPQFFTYLRPSSPVLKTLLALAKGKIKTISNNSSQYICAYTPAI